MATRRVMVDLDLNQNEIKSFLVDVLTADPGAPVEGQLWYNSTSQQLKLRKNGTTAVLAEGDVSQMVTRASAAGALNELILSAGADRSVKTWNLGAGIVAVNGSGVGSLAVADTDYATPSYVDSQIQASLAGMAWKDDVVAASTANVALASDLENGDVLDGVTLSTGDRILLKDQTDASENGVYIVAATGAPGRAEDMNASAEFNGAVIPVGGGTSNGGTTWRVTVNDPVVGTDDITITQFGSDVPDATTTVAGKVELATQAEAESKSDTQRAVTPAALASFTRKYAADISAATSGTVLASTHGLGATKNLVVQIYEDGTPNDQIDATIRVADNGDVSWETNSAITGHIVIIG